MQRRTFLRLVGVASIAPKKVQGAAVSGATVLYDDRATSISSVRSVPEDPTALWIRKRDLPRVNDFEIKPQGACRADICIPLTKDMVHGEYFNLTAFARKIGQAIVADSTARVWSFGEIQALRGSFLNGRMAPDITVPDRKGRAVRLADFRGRKVLLLTWASW